MLICEYILEYSYSKSGSVIIKPSSYNSLNNLEFSSNIQFKIIFNISLVINIIAILFSIILPFEIQNSNNIMYAYGNSVNVLYIMCGIYMFLTLFCVLLNIKRLLNKKYAPFMY